MKDLLKPQPNPTPNDHPPVWPELIERLSTGDFRSLVDDEAEKSAAFDKVLTDMAERNRQGIERYGCALQPFNGRNALFDAYQELLDACVYLEQARIEVAENCDRENILLLQTNLAVYQLVMLRALLDLDGEQKR